MPSTVLCRPRLFSLRELFSSHIPDCDRLQSGDLWLGWRQCDSLELVDTGQVLLLARGELFDAQQVSRRHLILSDVDPFTRRQWFEMLRIVSRIIYQVAFAREEEDSALLFPNVLSYRRYRLGVADLL